MHNGVHEQPHKCTVEIWDASAVGAVHHGRRMREGAVALQPIRQPLRQGEPLDEESVALVPRVRAQPPHAALRRAEVDVPPDPKAECHQRWDMKRLERSFRLGCRTPVAHELEERLLIAVPIPVSVRDTLPSDEAAVGDLQAQAPQQSRHGMSHGDLNLDGCLRS
jgi:hypothetical protein